MSRSMLSILLTHSSLCVLAQAILQAGEKSSFSVPFNTSYEPTRYTVSPSCMSRPQVIHLKTRRFFLFSAILFSLSARSISYLSWSCNRFCDIFQEYRAKEPRLFNSREELAHLTPSFLCILRNIDIRCYAVVSDNILPLRLRGFHRYTECRSFRWHGSLRVQRDSQHLRHPAY